MTSATDNSTVPVHPEIVKVSGGTLPPVDQRVILQGGDTFADATEIPSLPYSDAGTNVGYAHDYSPSCLGSSGADVVYFYAPAADGAINASLCGSTFDTGIAIYDGDASTQIACNDDFCGTASEVDNVPVLAGHTYYIVVTGYSTYTGDYTLNVTETPAPTPGDNCTDPIVVTLPAQLPYSDENHTCGRLDDYNATCLGSYDGGEDIIYQLDVTEDGTYGINLDPLGTTWTGILIDNACPPNPTTCIATSTMGGSTPHGFPAINLTAGTYYIMIDTWPSPTCISDFMLTINAATECNVVCPDPNTPEGEPDCYDEYVDVTNGGCNSTPNVFGTIVDGETICATAGTYLFTGLQYRDTDWYTLSVAERKTITATAVAEFPMLMYIISAPCPGGVTAGPLTVLPCSTGVLSAVVDPGDYYIFIGPSVFTGVTCGTPYYVTASVTDPPPPPTADFQVTAPGTWTDGNTCGAINNCTLRASEDQIWEITLPNDGTYTFSLCNSATDWDSYIYLGTSPCSQDLGYNDDGLNCPGLMSELRVTNLTAGVVYLTVEGFSDTYCGPYQLDVTYEPPCVVTCPPEGVPEGEPTCYDEYVDVTNGGCNSDPAVFQDLFDGDVICGTSGTFMFTGLNYRDTDWYQLTVSELKTINFTVDAEFPLLLFILDGNNGCAGAITLASGTAIECTPLTISTTVTAGTYWLWVGPSVFTGVPCGADYVASVTLTTPPPPPPNDLCENVVPVPLVAGTPLTFTGDNTNALAIGDCASFSSFANVWEGFTTTECLDITVDYCGTTPAFGNAWLGMAIDCPCTGTVPYFSFDVTTCPDGNVTVVFRHVPAGTYYYPVMNDPATGSVGPYTLNVNGTACPPPPANDLCSGAIQMTVPGTEVGSTADATLDSEFPTCGTTIDAAGIWYSVQGTGNTMTASTCNAYTTYDTKINVFCYSCETPICVGGNDDNCVEFGLRSSLSWCSDPTATYLVLVQGYGGATGDFQLDITDDGVPCTGAIVCGVPIFGVNPTEVNGQAAPGGSANQLLTISNTGDAQLDGTAYITIQAPSPLRTLPPTPIDNKGAISAPPTPLKVEVPMPPKDQRAILQGGDNCADFIDLGNTEPVSDAGTTAGYANNYGPFTAQPACWQGSFFANGSCAGPDVTFKWTAPYDSIYTFSLCGSGYDSGLLLYNFTCPTEPTEADIICGNDDACGLQSELTNIPLLAGQQILVVVDGYTGASGSYTLNIAAVVPPPPPPGCPEGSIVSQGPTLPDEAWTFATSSAELGYTAYESFVGLTAHINEVKVWGLQLTYNAGWSSCVEDPAMLQVKFYQDAGGFPGAEIASYDVSVSPVQTGNLFNGWPEVEFDVTLPEEVTLFSGWISVQDISVDGCNFLWQDSFGGDMMSLQSPDGGATFTVGAYDLSLCLMGTTFTPWLTIDQTSFSVAPGNTTQMNVMMNGTGLAVGTYYGAVIITTNEPTIAVHTIPVTFQITGGGTCNYHVGDANNSQVFNGLDVTYSVGYFKGGPPPPYSCECTPGHTWFVAGDVNASCSFNGLDVTFMVSYFKGGPMVHGCPDCLPAGDILLNPGTPVINAPAQNGAGQ